MLEQQLQTTSCRQLVGQYIPVKVDLQQKESKQLVSELFNVTLEGAPLMLLIGSNMKLLDQQGGVSAEPPTAFLRKGLVHQQRSRNVVDSDTINILNDTRIRIILRTIESAIENENIAGAVKMLRSATKKKMVTDSNSEMNQKLTEVIDGLNQDALEDLDRSRALLSEAETHFQGLLSMTRTIRSYSGLPKMKKTLGKEKKLLDSMAKKSNSLSQIKSIDKARSMEESGKNDQALKLYKGIINRYPDSDAANFCEKRISALEKE